MNTCTCFLLFGTFAHINSSPFATSIEDERGTTVKEIDKTVIGDENIPPLFSSVETFTDFIQVLVIILNTYNDDMFEEFMHIVDKKIRKYHYRGCKYYELKGKYEFRSLLAEQLDLLTRKPVYEQRAFINDKLNMMRLLYNDDRNVQELIDYINFLYRDEAKKMFRKILTDLVGYSEGYGKTKTREDLVNLIRKCIRAAVFIHTDLNVNVRRELKRHIARIKEFPSYTSSTTNFEAFESTNDESNTFKIFENISTEDKASKLSSELEPTRTTADIKEDNKLLTMFKTDTSEEKATLTLETSEIDEINSQDKKTYTSTNENDLLFYIMTTEKPRIVYKFESKSKMVERMLDGESAGTLATGKPNITKGLRRYANYNVENNPYSHTLNPIDLVVGAAHLLNSFLRLTL